jgi:Fe-S-cluster containining protein
LTDEEISRLAAFRSVSEVDFIQQFTRLTSDRRGLALQDKPNGECVFLDGKDCTVEPVKPQQCRDFPNLWNFTGFEKVCQALPKQVNPEEFRRLTNGRAQSQMTNDEWAGPCALAKVRPFVIRHLGDKAGVNGQYAAAHLGGLH